MDEFWYFLKNPAASPFWNMACDEWLFKNIAELGCPLLRVYEWDRPSLSIGYFQEYPEKLSKDWTVVRRLTGGGGVFHGTDLTFSLFFPKGHPWQRIKTLERYGEIHGRILKMFSRYSREIMFEDGLVDQNRMAKKNNEILNYQGNLSGISLGDSLNRYGKNRNSFCFEVPTRYDVVWNGVKIVGGAQKVGRQGVLHQGSIQAQPFFKNLSFESLKSSWEEDGVSFERFELSIFQLNKIRDLERRKYQDELWNKGRQWSFPIEKEFTSLVGC